LFLIYRIFGKTDDIAFQSHVSRKFCSKNRHTYPVYLWKNISCRKIGIDIALHPVAFPDSSSPEHTVQYLVASASKSIHDREYTRVNNRVLRKRRPRAQCDESTHKQRSRPHRRQRSIFCLFELLFVKVTSPMKKNLHRSSFTSTIYERRDAR